MAKKYTDEAVKSAATMSRDDYKAVKHMDKVQLTAYLQRIYRRGYDAGIKAEQERAVAAQTASDAPEAEG